MTKDPHLSIITICLNDKSGLEKTILSVKEQIFRDYEHIIIDGGSIDGSKEILEKYKIYLSYTVSERDKGRYQAMNKGIQNSKGTYLLFLNSGDYLADNFVLQKILSDADIPDIKYGNVIFEDMDGLRFLYEQPAVFSLKYFMEGTVLHPSAFVLKSLFLKLGMYDETYVIASDYNFFLKAIVTNYTKTKFYDVAVSVFNTLGISTNEKFKAQSENERISIQRKYINPIILDYYHEQEEYKKSFGYLLIKKAEKNSLINFLLKVVNKLADIIS